MAMGSDSRKQKRKKPEVSVAYMYRKDLGAKGIKYHGATSTTGKTTSTTDCGDDFDMEVSPAEVKRRRQRENRFACTSSRDAAPTVVYQPLSTTRTSSPLPTRTPLVGTNQSLEKSYLRLTDVPRPEHVRPLSVLIQSLAHIKAVYIDTEDFDWANDQLKSVRQDLVVQQLATLAAASSSSNSNGHNKLVLDVYETHSRILLEHGDLDEFNKCQTMIRSLTTTTSSSSGVEDCDDVVGSDSMVGQNCHGKEIVAGPRLQQSPEAADEFTAYSILYGIVRNSHLELRSLLLQAKQQQSTVANYAMHNRMSSCDHATEVLLAMNGSNYHAFFQLYQSAPHLSAYLMDFLLKRVRDSAMERIVAAHRPSVSVEQLQKWLLFSDGEETRLYLRQIGAVFVVERGIAAAAVATPPLYVDCKASQASIQFR